MDISRFPLHKEKVCIVCGNRLEDETDEYIVFIVDVNLGGHPVKKRKILGGHDDVVSMSPTLRFDWCSFYHPAFCVLGSQLYMIESSQLYRRIESDDPNLDGKLVRTYPLSDEICNLKVEKSMLKETVGMNCGKLFPKVMVTPDCKILAFSSTIDHCRQDECCDFELFDPMSMTWSILPNLPLLGYYYDCFRICSFTFIQKTVLFLGTEIGVFTLDLKGLRWNRSAFDGAECIPHHVGNSFVIIDEHICISPYVAFDIRPVPSGVFGPREIRQYTYPELSLFSRDYSNQFMDITSLFQDKNSLIVCFVQAGLNHVTKHPELMLHVYDCDLTECKKKLAGKKEVEESPILWESKRETLLLPGTSLLGTSKIVVLFRPVVFLCHRHLASSLCILFRNDCKYCLLCIDILIS